MQWRCSQCSSATGIKCFEERAVAIDEKLKMAEEKYLIANDLIRKARALERQFSERVTNPELMGKTGEPLCVLLPVSGKMVRVYTFCTFPIPACL